MKLFLVSLLAASANAFVIPSAQTTQTQLSAYSPRLGSNLQQEKPIVEDLKAPLTQIKTKYRAKDGSVILGHDFRLTMELLIAAPLIYYLHENDGTGMAGAAFHAALGAWIGWQANRVRGVFDKSALEFYNKAGWGVSWKAQPAKCDPRLQRKPDNWLVNGSPNRWNYETMTGYRFYPSLDFPVVTVLWETETADKKNTEDQRKYYGEQPHFFPTLFNARQFKEEMDKHGVPYKLPFV